MKLFNRDNQIYNPGDKELNEEQKKPHNHIIEFIIITVLWVLFGVFLSLIIYKVNAGVQVVGIIVCVVLISIGIFWLVILVPYISYLVVKLSHDKVLDFYRMIHIPLHKKPDYTLKGSCFPLINKRTGAELYVCSDYDDKKKIIQFAHDVRYESVNWLADKSIMLIMRNDNCNLRDENQRLKDRMEESIQVEVARYLVRLNTNRKMFARRQLYRADYGQDKEIYADGSPALGLTGPELPEETAFYNKQAEDLKKAKELKDSKDNETNKNQDSNKV